MQLGRNPDFRPITAEISAAAMHLQFDAPLYHFRARAPAATSTLQRDHHSGPMQTPRYQGKERLRITTSMLTHTKRRCSNETRTSIQFSQVTNPVISTREECKGRSRIKKDLPRASNPDLSPPRAPSLSQRLSPVSHTTSGVQTPRRAHTSL
jgi:hypothetical protein